ncbi:vacuolar protein sorting-associated protein 70 [[Candida] railenensis]|uniref:Peptide hydrolase n=1 Tax=[Candida] railenensis TaxID=45579 RepID=A0A9P0QQR9_9ASCO|nr:vacuolar protein sorting-associated protein 70 [[Candida] railenensis]
MADPAAASTPLLISRSDASPSERLSSRIDSNTNTNSNDDSNEFSVYYGSQIDGDVPNGNDFEDLDTQSKYDDEGNRIEDDDFVEDSLYERSKRKFSKARFWWFCSLGLVFIVIFNLSFLPRTSLSRDFRRWYNLHLTKADIKRDFLILTGISRSDKDGVSGEESLNFSLGNFTKLSAQSPVNLCANDNYELVRYVESRFKQFPSFNTKTYNYDFTDLTNPLDASLKLMDDKSSVLYDANLYEDKFKTPAYYSGGNSHSTQAQYLFVNEGKKEDYDYLIKNKFDPTGKIVILKKTWGKSRINLSIRERALIAKSYGVSGLIMYKEPPRKNDKDSFDKKLEHSIERDSLWEAGLSDDDSEVKDIDFPAIPVSYKNVLPILNTLNRPTSPNSFENWTYSPNPTSSSLFLKLETSFDDNSDSPRKLTNIISTVKGILNDGEVVIGVSRDSFTSSNPLSGHAIMLEIMNGFQKLMKMGWKPLRPIKFVSWDGTHDGLLGSTHYFNDSNSFDKNLPVAAYIHIDGDAVTGSQFKVDGNPSLNHVLKDIAKYVSIPRESTYFKSLAEDKSSYKEEELIDDDFAYNTESTSLYHYWKKQDNNSINAYLGDSIKHSDALNFQQHLGVPVVNLKFANDPKRDTSIYIPNSNYYSYDWVVQREIDNDMLLHGSLVRYVGLLTISLVEHEIIDHRIFPYVKTIQEFYHKVMNDASKVIGDMWQAREVPLFMINTADIYVDMDPTPLPNKPIVFQDLVIQFNILIDGLIDQSKVYDEFNRKVEKDLIKDYAWYHSYMKVKHYTQFKLANYKLLRLENELLLSSKAGDYNYLSFKSDGNDEQWFKHIVYGLSKFSVNYKISEFTNRDQKSVFTGMQNSLLDENFDQSVRWLVINYSKLKGLLKKMT